MNRRTRRAAARQRSVPIMPSVEPPMPDGGLPQMVTAAIFMAQRSDCDCEVCQILRNAADDMIAEALGGAPVALPEAADGD